jgi:hypothetical protein
MAQAIVAAGQFADQAKSLYYDIAGGSLSGLTPGSQLQIVQAQFNAESK